MFQRVTIIGNLGSDPELRYTQSGTPVCGFSVATNEVWKDQAGERQERTTWWRVSAWGQLGEVCNQYLQKGRRVFVEGTMAVDQETGGPRIWTDQNGQPRASLELRAATVKFLDGRSTMDDGMSGFDEQPARGAPRQQQGGGQGRGGYQQGGWSGGGSGPAGGGSQRRSTTSAGGRQQQAPDSIDDDGGFGPEEIPF